ncbi:MAG: hypothetical protein COA78_33580 [Blastopirellula sp.]|nr:MAG: hypothetical protein COA78_33580 [Blastopirellula sp.]
MEPKRQSHGGANGKLKDHADWLRRRLTANGNLTLDELCVELVSLGVIIRRSNVARLLHRPGLIHRKKPVRQ